MRISCLVVLLSVACCIHPNPSSCDGAVLSDPEMQTICENWVAYVVHETGDWAGSPAPSIRDVRRIAEDDTLLALVFSIDPSGFVAVPALRSLAPVKTYSETSPCEGDDQGGMPDLIRRKLLPAVRAFVEEHGSLNAVPPEGDSFSGQTHALWRDRLLSSPERFLAHLTRGALPRLEEFGPLVTSNWHQSVPYNNYCPVGCYDRRCVTGCAATAVAIMMHYHQWPPSGCGSNGYQWGGDGACSPSTPGAYLYADFSDAYDWEHMPDNADTNSTQEEQDAVAELGYEVGLSMHMYYSTQGSGPLVWDGVMDDILVENFRYEPGATWRRRREHATDAWWALIRAEVSAYRPIVYDTGVHAVVCSGWRETGDLRQYHMNWGWGGPMTVWWTLDDLAMCSFEDERMIYRVIPGNRRVTVRADGTGDYPTIQAAIDATPTGSVIELEDGTYTGPGNRNLDFLGKCLDVRSVSGDPDLCVIDCGGMSRAVTALGGAGQSVTVDGLTLTGGYAAGNGGSVWISGGSLIVVNCRVTGNEATGHGGGIACDSCAVHVEASWIEANTAGGDGGGVFVTGFGSRFEQTMLTSNTAGGSGGAAYLENETVWLSETIVASNGSAGIGGGLFTSAEKLEMYESTMAGNAAEMGGGGLRMEGPAWMEDCLITGNWTASDGGGVLFLAASPCRYDLLSTTVAGNFAGASGGGMHLAGPCTTDVFKVIVWGDGTEGEGSELYLDSGANPEAVVCCIDSLGIAGPGTLHWLSHDFSQDPGFCDPQDASLAPTAEGDYHLKDGSPCLPGPLPLIGALGHGCGKTVFTVRPDGSGDFATLAEAVDEAPWYDIVELASGVFTGAGNRNVDFAGKTLIVRSASGAADSSVIDCEGDGRAFRFCSGETEESIVENLTVRNGHAPHGGAILCQGASPAIQGCVFHDNSADSTGGAIRLTDSNALISRCTLSDNGAPQGSGIHASSSTPLVENTIVAYGAGGEAVSLEGDGTVDPACADVFGNAGGDWVGCLAGQDTVAGNLCVDPQFYDHENRDFHLLVSSPCFDAPECGRVGALGRKYLGIRVWRVPDDASSIAAAMDSAWAGDTVRVACGVYSEHSLTMTPGVWLRSETGDADCVTIDAESGGRILTCTDLDSTTVIEGITFRNGHAGGTWPANAGGAILCKNASPRITRCVFHQNSADYGGGLAGWTASPTVEHSTFFENGATDAGGGVYAYDNSAILLDGCIIVGSTAGEAVKCWFVSTADVRCSNLWGNAGGDWVGCVEGRNGVDGNLSADPAFCAPFDGHIASFSPCLPESSGAECDLIGALGIGCEYTDVPDGTGQASVVFFLGPAVPNPFNPLTQISFGIPVSAETHRVQLAVYDVLGRRVTTLVDDNLRPGVYQALWDGTDHHHVPVASGVYFCRLTWNGKADTRRMVLLQ